MENTQKNAASSLSSKDLFGRWIPVCQELPDAELSVMLCLDAQEVVSGHYDGKSWFMSEGYEIGSEDGQEVTHWCHYPDPPNVGQDESRNLV